MSVTGERLRGFLSLRIKEIDRQIERGTVALTTIKTDLERAALRMQAQFTEAQARIQRPVEGLSALGHMGGALGIDVGGNFRSSIGRVENSIAELQYKRGHAVWLQESFDPSKTYELDAVDLAMVGVVRGDLVGAMYNGVNDPFDLANCC